MVQIGTYALWHTFGDDGDGLDLRVLEKLHGGGVDTAGRCEVDYGVDVGVLAGCLLDFLVDGQQCLAGTPVHLADELTAEGVDDTGDGRLLALADEVEIEHTLNGPGLEAVDEASGLLTEKSMLRERAEGPARGSETLDVIVGGEAALCAIGAVRGRGSHGRGCESRGI
jgi:hypothetical protein